GLSPVFILCISRLFTLPMETGDHETGDRPRLFVNNCHRPPRFSTHCPPPQRKLNLFSEPRIPKNIIANRCICYLLDKTRIHLPCKQTSVIFLASLLIITKRAVLRMLRQHYIALAIGVRPIA